jgi:hypothetical protein
MINTVASAGKVAYDVCDFICDFQEDVENLPKDKAVGSTALVLENSKLYMINS